MATALTTHFNERLADSEALVARAAAGLGAATEALEAARAAQATDVAAAAALDSAIAATRERMSDPALTAADVEALAVSLRDDLIARRKLSAAMLARETGIAEAAQRREMHRALSTAARAEMDACTREAAEAAARGERHAGWLSTETGETVAALVAEAGVLLAEIGDTPAPAADPESEEAANRALIAAARDRVEADIPEVLRAHARARAARAVTDHGAAVAAHVADIEDAEAAFLAGTTGLAGVTAAARLAHDRAEEALRQAAVQMPLSRDRALGLLRGVTASAPLTAAQTTRIAEVALAEDHPALASEAALGAVEAQIRAARLDLEAATVAAQIADPVADPADDAGVQAAQGALDTLLGTPLSDAQSAHTAAHAAALDTWEVAVPAQAWANLARFDEAVALLGEIAATDIAARASAFTAAETALVTALAAADRVPRASRLAAAAADTARAGAAHLADRSARQALGALRGDA